MRQLEADERAEAAAARDHSDMAGLEHARHKRGHNPDEAFARRHQAGSVGADDARAVPGGSRVHRHDVLCWDVLGQHDQMLDPRLHRRHRRLVRGCGRNEHDGDIAAGLSHGLRRRGEDRHIAMPSARAFRIDTGHDLRAIGEHFLGPERALASGDAEHNDLATPAHYHCAARTAA